MSNDPGDTLEYRPAPSSPPGAPRPRSSEVQVDLAALSHKGNVRPNNEDVYLVVRADRALQTLLTNLPAGDVPERAGEVAYGMVVADGVGGEAAGEVASRMAVRTLVGLVLDTPDWVLRPGEEESERVMSRMARRYRQVDAVLGEAARIDSALKGMSTTMTVACSLSNDLFLGHVGDSRAYLVRGDKIHQLTRDHTGAQALAAMGIIQPEQVKTHRLRHVLTRVLGAGSGRVEADVQRLSLSDGDQVLLCTDGLTEMVDTAAIAEALRGGGTAAEACQALVELALKNGGKDNVTVALARYRFGQAS